MGIMRSWIVVAIIASTLSGQALAASALEKLERGVYLEETAGKIREAMQVYDSLAREEQVNRPVVAEAQYRLGKCYRKENENEKARQVFVDLISRFSDQQKFVDAARRELNTLPFAVPTPPGAAAKSEAEKLSAKGWQLWQSRQLAEAEAEFRKAVAIDPTNPNAWNGLGWALSNQGRAADAVTAFTEVVRLEPKHAGALNGLGWASYSGGKVDEAITWWEKAIEALPTGTAAYSGLARAQAERKEYDQAIKTLEQWLTVEPNSSQAKTELDRIRKLVSGNTGAASLVPPLGMKYSADQIRSMSIDHFFRFLGREPESGYDQFAAMWALTEKGKKGTDAERQDILKKASEHLDAEKTTNAARWHAAYVLSGMGDARSIPILTKILHHDSGVLDRSVAACALSEFNHPDAEAALKRAQQIEKDASVQEWIQKALSDKLELGKLKSSKVAPATLESDSSNSSQSANGVDKLMKQIDERMQSLQQLVASGNTTWLDKKDISDVWTEWANNGRSKADKEAAIAEIEKHLATHNTDPLYPWRLNGLLATASLDLGRADEAATYLDEALKTYPNAKYHDPSKHSKYQHLVNERALLILKKDGPEAAEQYLTDKVANDPKFDYPFLLFWKQEYGAPALQARYAPFVEKVKASYAARKQAFPDKASQIDMYSRQLQ